MPMPLGLQPEATCNPEYLWVLPEGVRIYTGLRLMSGCLFVGIIWLTLAVALQPRSAERSSLQRDAGLCAAWALLLSLHSLAGNYLQARQRRSAAKAAPELLAGTRYTALRQAQSCKDSPRRLTHGNSKQMSKFLSLNFKQT